MLDVHPPHHTPATWRDFFLHIATITVGLLIAIGLEQTVEFFHHRHQRQRLLEDLDAEHRSTLKDADDSLGATRLTLNWQAARITAMRLAAAQAKPYIPPVYPATPAAMFPDDHVWRAAKASGLSALLPQQNVIADSEIEGLITQMEAVELQAARAQAQEIGVCTTLARPGESTPDLAHADNSHVQGCIAAMLVSYTLGKELYLQESSIAGAEKAIADGHADWNNIGASEAAEVRTRFAQLTPPQ